MKVERINEYVLVTTVVVIGILLAIACGRWAGTGANSDIWLLAGAIVYIVTCLSLRTHIWILIPMFWSCAGQLNSIPGHVPLRDVFVVGVVCYYFTLKAFKILRYRPSYSWLDIIMMLNVLYIATLYIRNPVGVNALGTDFVGGRAYFEVIFALGAYWIINQVIIPPKQAKIFPLLLCAVSAFFTFINTVTYVFPSTAPILGKLYGGVDIETYRREQNGTDSSEGDVRTEYLGNVGTSMFGVACAYLKPLTLINPMYFWRFLLMCVAFYFSLKSGHRITIPAMVFVMLLAAYFRQGMAAVVIMVLIAIPPTVALLAGQGHLYNLPYSTQRTLCMLPGKWDPDVLHEAQDSTQWRIQMWQQVLTENTYIHDKIFGDGFGYSKEDLASMAINGNQDDFMRTDEVHSGPVSTLRVGGFVGLLLFILLLVALAIRAWRLIRRAKGTPFYPVSLFVGIGAIYKPFAFVLIFGDFKSDLPDSIMMVGMLNMLTRGLAAYLKSVEEPPPPVAFKKTIQALAPIPAPALH